jgi:hypothetical protein
MSTCSSYAEFRHKAPTDNDLNLTYNSGLLPLQPNGDMDRENGILKSTVVDTIVLNLKNSGIIPTLTNTDLFIKKQNDLIQNVKSEYCFYYSRYAYSLQKLLKAMSDSNTVVINKYLDYTQSLNKKMNDLIQIINGVNGELLLSNTDMTQGIKKFDDEIKQLHMKLVNQNKIISSNEAVAKLNKEMVKYTEEKSRYTNNLLKMYSVLNIVALSLLVYVYKSAGE